jgi:hypothetical protein
MAFDLGKTLRRVRYGSPIVVVSGLPRSGTSMAMKMLEAGGIEIVTDGRRTADDDNPKGYFEDERVKDLGKTQNRAWLRETRGRAVKIISFLLKDLPADNNYRVLFMERSLAEVLASQTKMLDHLGEENESEDERMKDVYTDHLRQVKFMLRYRRHFDTLVVEHRRALTEPEVVARGINDFLGGGLDVEAMAAVVDPSLYRNRE